MTRPDNSPRTIWLVVTDALLLAACYVAASYALIEAGAGLYLIYENGALAIAVVIAAILLAGHLQTLYSDRSIGSRTALALRLNTVMSVALLAEGLVQYVDRDAALPLPIMLLGTGMAVPVLFLWRMFYFGLIKRKIGPQSVLLAGTNTMMRAIARGLRAYPGDALAVQGYIDDALPAGADVQGVPVLGRIADLPDLCRRLRPDRVITDPSLLSPALAKQVADTGVMLEKPAAVYERVFGRVCLASLDPTGWIFADEFGPAPVRLAAQSVYTNIVGILAALVLAPLYALIALLIKLTSAGPVFELERAMGWNLIPFTRFRFRCTHSGASTGGQAQLTIVGRWLRRLHLDGLPQLMNVLRGEMALVGPRPIRTDDAAVLIDTLSYYRQRFAVKPGIASWAEVNGVTDEHDIHTSIEYELFYVSHVSLSLDTYIALQSLAMLFRKSRPANREAAGE